MTELGWIRLRNCILKLLTLLSSLLLPPTLGLLACPPSLGVAPRTVWHSQISASRRGNSAAIAEQQQLPDPCATLTPAPHWWRSEERGVQFICYTTIITLLQLSGPKNISRLVGDGGLWAVKLLIRSVNNNVCMFCLPFFVSFLLQKPVKSRLIGVSRPLTSSVLVTEVGKAPHVAEADDGAGHR